MTPNLANDIPAAHFDRLIDVTNLRRPSPIT
jgi:hypothetical protein